MSIATEISRLQNAKASIKTSIENKGVEVPSATTLDGYSSLIDSITGGGDIDWSAIGYDSMPQAIQDGYDYAKTIKQNWTSGSMWNKFSNDYKLMFMPYVNTSNSDDFEGAFSYCSSLINVPLLDTSNGTYFSNMFMECGSLKTIPKFDTSKLTECSKMFLKCYSLESVPLFDTSKSTNVSSMFSECKSLKTIPQFDTSNATNVSQMLAQCESINNVPELDFGNATSVSTVISNYSGTLINLNGFKDIGKAYSTTMSANTYQYTLSLQINSLSHDSLMNVINKVYDIATKGCNTQRLILGSSNVAKLTAEEIAIATNKGWTVS